MVFHKYIIIIIIINAPDIHALYAFCYNCIKLIQIHMSLFFFMKFMYFYFYSFMVTSNIKLIEKWLFLLHFISVTHIIFWVIFYLYGIDLSFVLISFIIIFSKNMLENFIQSVYMLQHVCFFVDDMILIHIKD